MNSKFIFSYSSMVMEVPVFFNLLPYIISENSFSYFYFKYFFNVVENLNPFKLFLIMNYHHFYLNFKDFTNSIMSYLSCALLELLVMLMILIYCATLFSNIMFFINYHFIIQIYLLFKNTYFINFIF